MKKILPLILFVFVAISSGKDMSPGWMTSTDNLGGKVIQWGFVQNERAPIHFLGGSLLAKGLNNSYTRLSPKATLLIVTGIGIGWEVYQTSLFDDFGKVSQSERYWFDATGDAISMGLGALLALSDFGKVSFSVDQSQLQIHWPL
ncbi:MAG: hypothetical protein V3U24_05955 [Candidatus Neomarinimicrobiota bacterium]